MATSSRKTTTQVPAIDHLEAEALVALIKHANDLLERKREQTKVKLLADMRMTAEKAGLDFDELVGAGVARTRRQRSDIGITLPPKYRGPNGEIYKGRGPVPKWLKMLERKGVDREKFRVKGT